MFFIAMLLVAAEPSIQAIVEPARGLNRYVDGTVYAPR
jgi:hypothetical protein